MCKKAKKKGKNNEANGVRLIKNPKRFRLRLISFFCILFFAVFFCAVIVIKIQHGEEYENKAKAQSGAYLDSVLTAMRGSIYASGGECLVYSSVSYNVIMDPYVLQQATTAQKTSTIDLLCKVLNISDKTKVSKYLKEEYKNRRYESVENGQNITEEQKTLLDKYIEEGDIKGVWFESKENRTYPYNELLAQVLGFNQVYGLDASYNDELTGTDGRKLMVETSEGDYVTQETPAENGNNLILTINLGIQQVMERKMTEIVDETNALSACAICMNPQTGAIYGWVSFPSFNLNDVTELHAASPRFYETYAETKDYAQRAWNNMGINYTYQPGSTFKPMAAAISLEENAVSPKEQFFCGKEGYLVPGTLNYTIHCYGMNTHGYETLREILLNSCNQGMAQIVERLNSKTFWSYLNNLGVGRETGIDLPGESTAKGLVYTEETLGIAEKAACSFGQGFNLTPIQLATAFSAVINGGKIIEPYLVEEITDASGKVLSTHTVTEKRTVFSEDVSETLRDYLQSCYASYHKNNLINVDGYDTLIGAKTGTAQQGNYATDADVVNFETFAPVDDPEVMLLVVLNHTNKQQSIDAIHVSEAILKEILPILGIYAE